MLNRNLASDKSNVDSFLLCSFLGIFGIHRLYVGKYFTATLQFLSMGGFLIWTLIDWVAIIREEFSDRDGKLLTWERNKKGEYAGLKVRFAAHVIDTTLIAVGSYLSFAVIIDVLSIQFESNLIFLLQELEELIEIIISVLYITIFTASKRQGTIGKSIVGIIVVDTQMKGLSFSHSLGRCLAYYFSYLTLGIGFIMIAWTKRHIALHDKIAQTYVIYGRS